VSFILRDFQARNKANIRNLFRKVRSVLYVAPTGSGKTVTAASIIEAANAKETCTWFVAHRRELIEQASETLWKSNVRNGILMAGYRYEPHLPVQVCGIDTLRSRLLNDNKLVLVRSPTFLVIDEAHRSLARTYLKLFERFPNAFRLGLTASPVRSDGRGLGHVYDALELAPSVAELIEQGWLVRPRYFTGECAELTGIKTQDGDYAPGELEIRYNRADLRGDVVEQWLRLANGRKTIVFATGVRHSLALAEDFNARGIPAFHLDGSTNKYLRMDQFDEFRHSDKWKVLVNCNIATEGVDVPEVGCVQMATATKIISRYIQMGGRGLRTCEEIGKQDCIIIDHGENIKRHGFLEDPIPWSLDTNGRLQDRLPAVRDKLPRIFVCVNCGHTFSGQLRCPECRTRLEIQPHHELISTPEDLIQVTRGAAGIEVADKQRTYSEVQRRNFYAQLLGYCKEKGYKYNWADHKFRAKFGEWPPWPMTSIIPQRPTDLVTAYCHGQQVAWRIRNRKRKQKEQQANGQADAR